MQVKQTLTRVYVNDMDAAIQFYEQLFGESCASRFSYAQMDLEIARVGAVLIIAGTDQALTPFKITHATMLVDSVDEFKAFLLGNGATVVRDIQQVPTGLNMTIRHTDGLTIEYVEHRK